MQKRILFHEIKRCFLVLLAACIMALNIKTFVRTGSGLLPGGFNGLTLLIQQIALKFFNAEVPFSIINFLLNSVPVVISFHFIGKKFTLYSCVMIIASGVLSDFIPAYQITNDLLLASVFGGIINALAISLCLFADATSGGTDFIAIFLSEKYGIDSWNYVLFINCFILGSAGVLFGWDKALYSIIFQFASTQVLHALYRRYQKQTLFIITDYPLNVYEQIKDCTNHDATVFKGVGCYRGVEKTMVYSVVSSDEIKKVVSAVRKIDSSAFINVVKTEQITGRFYKRPND